MSTAVKEAMTLLEVLPEADQNFVLEFIKKMVLAWDPDFTKVTPSEKKRLEEAEQEFINHETISHDEIDWD